MDLLLPSIFDMVSMVRGSNREIVMSDGSGAETM
jgi:hypothetical protein